MKIFLGKAKEIKSMTEIEKSVIRNIKTNPLEILDMTIDQFAQKCFTTKSTIVKTLKKIEISGYKELKTLIYAEGTKIKDTIEGVSAVGRDSIKNIVATDALLMNSGLDKIKLNINLNSYIGIIYTKATKSIAYSFKKNLDTLGIKCKVLSSYGDEFHIKSFDTLIFLSCSGVNQDIYKKAKYIKDSGQCSDKVIISIAATNTSNIRELSNIILLGSRYLSVTEKEYHLTSQSHLVIWFIITKVIQEIYDANKKEIEERFKYF